MEENIDFILIACPKCSREVKVTKDKALAKQEVSCGNCKSRSKAREAISTKLRRGLETREDWAWEWFYRIFGMTAIKYLQRRLGVQPQRAEDALHGVLIEIMEKPEIVTGARNLEGLLNVCVLRQFIDDSRKEKIGQNVRIEDQAEKILGCTMPADRIFELEEIPERLSSDERNILELDRQGNSYDEISQHLSIPKGTVRSRLSRARESARKLYKNGVQNEKRTAKSGLNGASQSARRIYKGGGRHEKARTKSS